MTPIMTSVLSGTVYPDQARHHRSGCLHVTPPTSGSGSQWLEIDGLPLDSIPIRCALRPGARRVPVYGIYKWSIPVKRWSVGYLKVPLRLV